MQAQEEAKVFCLVVSATTAIMNLVLGEVEPSFPQNVAAVTQDCCSPASARVATRSTVKVQNQLTSFTSPSGSHSQIGGSEYVPGRARRDWMFALCRWGSRSRASGSSGRWRGWEGVIW